MRKKEFIPASKIKCRILKICKYNNVAVTAKLCGVISYRPQLGEGQNARSQRINVFNG